MPTVRPGPALEPFEFLRLMTAIDLPHRLRERLAAPVTKFLVATACAASALVFRELIDMGFPGAGPFASTMPFVLCATLFASWEAGAATLAVTALHAWCFVLPAEGSFAFAQPGDGPRVAVNVASGAALVAMGAYFRTMARRALAERDRVAAERTTLLEELDHRVRNNFAMMASVIRHESREAGSEVAARALTRVGGRLESIAFAHDALNLRAAGVGKVAMRSYLAKLCDSLETGIFRDMNVAVDSRVATIALPREEAILIGLVVNELCTNAAKHAFEGRERGRVVVSLDLCVDDVLVAVEDDGVGLPSDAPQAGAGQGRSLLAAFAARSGGELRQEPTATGARVELRLPGLAAR